MKSDEEVRDLFEQDVREQMKAGQLSGTPYFVRRAEAPHQYARHDIHAAWRAFLRGYRVAARERERHSSPRQVERADSRDAKKSIPKSAGKESAP